VRHPELIGECEVSQQTQTLNRTPHTQLTKEPDATVHFRHPECLARIRNVPAFIW
jgi:hypothetical protein